MPRDLTHIIIADEAIQEMEQQSGKKLGSSAMALHFGSISLDAFLYSSDVTASKKMHGGRGDDVRLPVVEMLDDIRKEKNPEIAEKKKAFAFGYLSHMATDMVFHPFVYSMAGYSEDKKDVDNNNARHRYIETWLDVHFVEKKGYNFDNFRPLREIVSKTSDRKMLSEFLCDNLEKAYDLDKNPSFDCKVGLMTQLYLGKVTRNPKLNKIVNKLDNFFDGRLKQFSAGFYQTDKEVPKVLKGLTSYQHPVTGEKVLETLDTLKRGSIDKTKQFILAATEYLKDANKDKLLQKIPNLCLDTGIENTSFKDLKNITPVELSAVKGDKYKSFIAKQPIKKFKSGKSNMLVQQKVLSALKANGRV